MDNQPRLETVTTYTSLIQDFKSCLKTSIFSHKRKQFEVSLVLVNKFIQKGHLQLLPQALSSARQPDIYVTAKPKSTILEYSECINRLSHRAIAKNMLCMFLWRTFWCKFIAGLENTKALECVVLKNNHQASLEIVFLCAMTGYQYRAKFCDYVNHSQR